MGQYPGLEAGINQWFLSFPRPSRLYLFLANFANGGDKPHALDKWGQGAIMDQIDSDISNERIQRLQVKCISHYRRLVLVLNQVPRCRLPEGSLFTDTEKLGFPDFAHTLREDCFCFFRVTRSSAFANSLTFDDLVDVPDTFAGLETRGSSSSHC